jgi:cell wall-associated NlpC family hydrolase
MVGVAGNRRITCSIFCVFVLLFSACTAGRPVSQQPESVYPYKYLKRIRFAIQVGAFQDQDNAVRLTEKLQQQGLEAYHYIDTSGLYKVRFGNYSTRSTARREAGFLQARGVIDEYYIVSPQIAAMADDLRGELVQTARSFIGIPYKWGGDSRREGFDCSGLTMTVYQLNGLDLPRTSRQQWVAGTPIGRRELARGDLVFFATSGGKRVSHVGIYVGQNRFIHAPGRGKVIRVASLSNGYYRKRYLGGRRYL